MPFPGVDFGFRFRTGEGIDLKFAEYSQVFENEGKGRILCFGGLTSGSRFAQGNVDEWGMSVRRKDERSRSFSPSGTPARCFSRGHATQLWTFETAFPFTSQKSSWWWFRELGEPVVRCRMEVGNLGQAQNGLNLVLKAAVERMIFTYIRLASTNSLYNPPSKRSSHMPSEDMLLETR